MISAKKARLFSNDFAINAAFPLETAIIRSFHRMTANGLSGDQLSLKMAIAGIYSAVREGLQSYVSYILSPIDVAILTSHGFEVESEKEEDSKYHIINWENAGTSTNQQG